MASLILQRQHMSWYSQTIKGLGIPPQLVGRARALSFPTTSPDGEYGARAPSVTVTYRSL